MEYYVVEIVECGSPSDWYSNKIGMLLRVCDTDTEDRFYKIDVKQQKPRYVRKTDTFKRITLKHVSEFNNRPSINFKDITDNEIQFIRLTWDGLTTKQIGEGMYMSKRTIDGYRSSIYDKTGSNNIVGMIRYALKNKIIEL